MINDGQKSYEAGREEKGICRFWDGRMSMCLELEKLLQLGTIDLEVLLMGTEKEHTKAWNDNFTHGLLSKY